MVTEYILVSIKDNEPQEWYATMNIYKLQEFIRTKYGDVVVQEFKNKFSQPGNKFCFHEVERNYVYCLKHVYMG